MTVAADADAATKESVMANDGGAGAQIAGTDDLAVPVWDVAVRLFHWTLVALVVAAVVTAQLGGNAMVWHMRSGFAVLVLVLFRILWGFAGSQHARFASFVRGPGEVIAYARAFAGGAHPTFAGHNPLGGWSVVALLVVLLAQATTGLFSNDDIATDGPLVKLVSKALSDTITGLHHRNAWLIGGLVALHLGAVFYHQLVLRDNLIHPMVTGVKRLPATFATGADAPVPMLRAVVLFGLCALAVWWVVTKV